MSFAQLGLSKPLLNALNHLGYAEPTAIQAQAIPAALAGKDIIGEAQTGTGKTASFTLPVLEQLITDNTLRGKRIRALVLTPTRELAMQVAASITQYAQYTRLSCMAMYGGADMQAQKQQLIQGVDVLVATPGRLLDMAFQRALYFDALEYLIIDEADRMLDMGFIDDINKIVARLPEQRQTLLFTATLNNDVRFLASTISDPDEEISVIKKRSNAPKIQQWLVTVDKDTKSSLLSHLIQTQQWQQALIFTEKKHSAAKLVEQLAKRGIIAEAIHSGRSQASREQVLADFKTGTLAFLVATGVAARGLDIQGLERVVNYDLPHPADDYIHRIGRTGRAGASGEAISLVSKDDFKNLCAIESRLGHIIQRKAFEGFTVRKTVPVSVLNYAPKQQR